MTSTEPSEETSPVKPITLLGGLAALLACQLAGEALVVGIRSLAPAFVFPGPVAGMLLLLGVMVARKRVHTGVDAAATGLIGLLSLLFVPSAVGIIQYGELIAGWGGPLLLAVVGSTVLTLLATVGTYLVLARLVGSREP